MVQDAALQPDNLNITRTAGLGLLLHHQHQQSQGLYLYIQAQMDHATSVLMAEATAITLAALLTKQLLLHSASFFTDNQAMVDYYNSNGLSNPPEWNIKTITATLLKTMHQSHFKVYKVPRTPNTTAHSLARQAFQSGANH
jgi:ribonuclease HI